MKTSSLLVLVLALAGPGCTSSPADPVDSGPPPADADGGALDLTGDAAGSADAHDLADAGAGDGATTADVGSDATPAAPEAGRVATGAAHSCALFGEGTLACWGDNAQGQVDSSLQGQPRPVLLEAEDAPGWRSVAAGARHTCAISLAGALHCWGDNADGQLGDGTRENRGSRGPVLEVGDSGSWLKVAAGTAHTCALRAGGALYCWGSQTSGQIGDPAAMNPAVEPTRVAGTWTDVTAGADHACGQQAGGQLLCWGSNAWGQVGSGPLDEAVDEPLPVALGGWRLVSAGGNAAYGFTCGLRTDDRLHCWGYNAAGQLGLGDAGIQPQSPMQVGEASWSWVAANVGLLLDYRAHACGVQADLSLHCWGNNEMGQLGSDPQALPASPAPARVGQDLDWRTVATGGAHSCGERQDGSIWCWGAGDLGQLGTGSLDPSADPTEVTLP